VHVGCVKQSAKIVSIRKIDAAASVVGGSPRRQSQSRAADMVLLDDVASVCQDELGNGERGICRYVCVWRG
jgi:hypothetical protein